MKLPFKKIGSEPTRITNLIKANEEVGTYFYQKGKFSCIFQVEKQSTRDGFWYFYKEKNGKKVLLDSNKEKSWMVLGKFMKFDLFKKDVEDQINIIENEGFDWLPEYEPSFDDTILECITHHELDKLLQTDKYLDIDSVRKKYPFSEEFIKKYKKALSDINNLLTNENIENLSYSQKIFLLEYAYSDKQISADFKMKKGLLLEFKQYFEILWSSLDNSSTSFSRFGLLLDSTNTIEIYLFKLHELFEIFWAVKYFLNEAIKICMNWENQVIWFSIKDLGRFGIIKSNGLTKYLFARKIGITYLQESQIDYIKYKNWTLYICDAKLSKDNIDDKELLEWEQQLKGYSNKYLMENIYQDVSKLRKKAESGIKYHENNARDWEYDRVLETLKQFIWGNYQEKEYQFRHRIIDNLWTALNSERKLIIDLGDLLNITSKNDRHISFNKKKAEELGIIINYLFDVK